MANKIISFGTSENLINSNTVSASQELSANLEVYRDVSMESMFSGHNSPTMQPNVEKVMCLVDEDNIRSALSFIYGPDVDAKTKSSLNEYLPVAYDNSISIDEYREMLMRWCASQLSNYNSNLHIWKQLSTWKIAKNVNVKAVFDSLRNIFTWNKCERILLPEFGSNLRSMLYEGITPQTEEAIIAEIYSCVSDWEPRIQIASIRNVSTVDDTEDNTIHLEVVFTIPSLGDEQYTYSFSYTMGA